MTKFNSGALLRNRRARFILPLLLLVTSFSSSCLQSQSISQRLGLSAPRMSVRLKSLSIVHTLAGSGEGDSPRFGDPFGVAVGSDNAVFVTDGQSPRKEDGGCVWRIDEDGAATLIAKNLDTPSGIAIASDGTLVVAETGAHVIKRINPQTGETTVIAGVPAQAGFRDGQGAQALFNAPIGVGVGADNSIFVADTYNDRIRRINPQGEVSTVAGGGGGDNKPGYADAENGLDARFHTPCGLVVRANNSLIVADTGNGRLRKVEIGGAVTTLAGTDEAGVVDGSALDAEFSEPVGITADANENLYVADARGGALRRLTLNGSSVEVATIAGQVLDGEGRSGFADGDLANARLRRPSGVAVAPGGEIVFADTGNKLLRAVVGEGRLRGDALAPARALALHPDAAAMRAMGAPRWCYEPPQQPREIAATFGEVRGVVPDVGEKAIEEAEMGLAPAQPTPQANTNRNADGRNQNAQRDVNQQGSQSRQPSAANVARNIKLTNAANRNGEREGRQATKGKNVEQNAKGERKQNSNAEPKTERKQDAKNDVNAASRQDAKSGTKPNAKSEAKPEGKQTIEIVEAEQPGLNGAGNVKPRLSPLVHAWFHNGLDIPGIVYGEQVYTVRGERVLLPMAIEDVGTSRERIRFPTLGYIHVRIGRDMDNRDITDGNRFIVVREGNRPVEVRIRRGTRFPPGAFLGTLNNQSHVHLIAGEAGAELNALAALELPGISDTVAPTINRSRVRFVRPDNTPFDIEASTLKTRDTRSSASSAAPIATVRGDVRIVVPAFDQMDGNKPNRRLGVYQLGYQILTPEGTPMPGFENPRLTVSFETLPEEEYAPLIAYAVGSKAGYTPGTTFAYIATNRVRDRQAQEDFWHTDEIPDGSYIVRVFAADFFGNRRTEDFTVKVVNKTVNDEHGTMN